VEGRRYHWVLQGLDTTVVLDLPDFEPQLFAMHAGDQLVVVDSGDGTSAALYSRRQVATVTAFDLSPMRRSQQAAWDRIFVGIDFATPRPLQSAAMRCHESGGRGVPAKQAGVRRHWSAGTVH